MDLRGDGSYILAGVAADLNDARNRIALAAGARLDANLRLARLHRTNAERVRAGLARGDFDHSVRISHNA